MPAPTAAPESISAPRVGRVVGVGVALVRTLDEVAEDHAVGPVGPRSTPARGSPANSADSATELGVLVPQTGLVTARAWPPRTDWWIPRPPAKAKLREILRDHADGLTVTGTETVEGAVRDWLTYGLVGCPPTLSRITPTSPRTASSRHWAGAAYVTCLPMTSTAGCSAGHRSRHAHPAPHALDPQPRCRARHGSRQGQAQRSRTLCRSGRAGWTPVEITDPSPGRRAARCRQRLADACLYRRVTDVRDPHRGGASAALARRRPAREPDATPPVPPSVSVLRSVRQDGDTKTRKSRRRLAIAAPIVDALTAHRSALDHGPYPTSSCSARATEPRWTGTTSCVPSAPLFVRPASTPTSGHHGSCATPLSPCSRSQACASRTSPAWSATAAPPSPSAYADTNCGPCWRKVPPRWTSSSANVRSRSHSVSHSVPRTGSRSHRSRSERSNDGREH